MCAKALIKYSFFTLVLLLGSHYSSAQTETAAPGAASTSENNERWYQVEVIVFSRSESASQQEVWPKNIQLSYPANTIALKPAEASDPTGFTQLKTSDRQLNAQAATLARSGSYTLLFHQAWRQMITGQKTSILISGGKLFSGHHELEGSIDLNVAQYLQLETNLWLTQFVSAQMASASDSGWPLLPEIPADELRDGEMSISDSSSDQPADYLSKRTVKLHQERSMRSGEVHYIDHPLLGMIIKIVPYDAPKL